MDTRLYEKLGLSLAQKNKYEINIIGFWSKNIPTIPSIKFYPIFSFKRNSLKRILSPLKYYNLLRKVKPSIIIVTTAELLIVSVIYKILFGSKLCYDVQENYYRNIKYAPTYPKSVRQGLAWIVKTVEDCSERWIDHYFLAEECYRYERNFPKEKSSVVLNKFKPLKPINTCQPLSKLPKIRFLLTGTIAENYGIFKAIDFTNNISKIYPDISLKIVGFAPSQEIIKKVRRKIKGCSFIELETDEKPLPHEEIIDSIAEADFALLPYQPDKSIENCFPTKIWEYMAHGLPMIIQNHDKWVEYCQRHESCLPIDFNQYNVQWVIDEILTKKFYPSGLPNDVFWESEELTLIQSIDKLLNNI